MTRRLLPSVGTRLLAEKRKPSRSVVIAVVVEDPSFPDGRALDVEGRRYGSLSEAASELTGQRRNGWLWWRREDGRYVGEEDPSTFVP